MSYVYTPDNVRVIHFGNSHEDFRAEEEPDADPDVEMVFVSQADSQRKKPRNMNSRQERHRRVWWKRK